MFYVCVFYIRVVICFISSNVLLTFAEY